MDIEELRAHCLELTVEVERRLKLLRDYSMTPGNAWLARNEMSKIAQLMGDLEEMIDAIKASE